MNCPYCKTNLEKLENYDNIYKYHECPECKNQVWLDYDEWCYEDEEGYIECSDLFEWLKEEKY